jgi:hypothetical protein
MLNSGAGVRLIILLLIGSTPTTRVATCVPEHVRVNLETKLGLGARAFDHAGKACRAKRCPSFRGEHECRLGLLLPL